jgi:hypothetical protein
MYLTIYVLERDDPEFNFCRLLSDAKKTVAQWTSMSDYISSFDSSIIKNIMTF